jgi:hypothetical protein
VLYIVVTFQLFRISQSVPDVMDKRSLIFYCGKKFVWVGEAYTVGA